MVVRVRLNQARIAEILAESKHLKQLSLRELAKKTGLSYQTVFRYMHNDVKHMQIKTVRKLAQALGVSMDYLVIHTFTEKEWW